MDLKQIKSHAPALPPLELLKPLIYKHNGKTEWGQSNDLNLKNRFEFIKKLYADYSTKDRKLVKFLLSQEIKYAQEEGDYSFGLNLTTFMLFTIMEVSDVALLYDAKFETCFDAQCVLDIELVFGLDLEDTKTYFTINKDTERDVLGVIKKYETRPYRQRAEYLKFYTERRIPSLLEEEY